MAESDPKRMRPVGQPDRRSFEADEDPLIELARIVSEDSGFYGGKSEKPKAAPEARQVMPRREPADRNAVSADLEAELLQELESSFASRSSAPLSRSRSAPQPAVAAQPADDADDLLRSIEEQLGEFERRARESKRRTGCTGRAGRRAGVGGSDPCPAWSGASQRQWRGRGMVRSAPRRNAPKSLARQRPHRSPTGLRVRPAPRRTAIGPARRATPRLVEETPNP